MLRIFFSFLCVKYISFFHLFVFIRVEFERNNKYAKKGTKSAMEFSDIAALTFAA